MADRGGVGKRACDLGGDGGIFILLIRVISGERRVQRGGNLARRAGVIWVFERRREHGCCVRAVLRPCRVAWDLWEVSTVYRLHVGISYKKLKLYARCDEMKSCRSGTFVGR